MGLLLFLAEQTAALAGRAARAIAGFNMQDDVYIMRKMSFEVTYYLVTDFVGCAYRYFWVECYVYIDKTRGSGFARAESMGGVHSGI